VFCKRRYRKIRQSTGQNRKRKMKLKKRRNEGYEERRDEGQEVKVPLWDMVHGL
jgi:hypothetical protein